MSLFLGLSIKFLNGPKHRQLNSTEKDILGTILKLFWEKRCNELHISLRELATTCEQFSTTKFSFIKIYRALKKFKKLELLTFQQSKSVTLNEHKRGHNFHVLSIVDSDIYECLFNLKRTSNVTLNEHIAERNAPIHSTMLYDNIYTSSSKPSSSKPLHPKNAAAVFSCLKDLEEIDEDGKISITKEFKEDEQSVINALETIRSRKTPPYNFGGLLRSLARKKLDKPMKNASPQDNKALAEKASIEIAKTKKGTLEINNKGALYYHGSISTGLGYEQGGFKIWLQEILDRCGVKMPDVEKVKSRIEYLSQEKETIENKEFACL